MIFLMIIKQNLKQSLEIKFHCVQFVKKIWFTFKNYLKKEKNKEKNMSQYINMNLESPEEDIEKIMEIIY